MSKEKGKFSPASSVSRIVERPLLSGSYAYFSLRLVDRASDRAVWGWGNFEAKKRSESDREFLGVGRCGKARDLGGVRVATRGGEKSVVERIGGGDGSRS